jgi:hypothetical protein
MSAVAEKDLSTGEAAQAIGIFHWQLVRLFTRGLVPEARRFGRYRAIAPADLPALRAAARSAGYLPEGQ